MILEHGSSERSPQAFSKIIIIFKKQHYWIFRIKTLSVFWHFLGAMRAAASRGTQVSWKWSYSPQCFSSSTLASPARWWPCGEVYAQPRPAHMPHLGREGNKWWTLTTRDFFQYIYMLPLLLPLPQDTPSPPAARGAGVLLSKPDPVSEHWGLQSPDYTSQNAENATPNTSTLQGNAVLRFPCWAACGWN